MVEAYTYNSKAKITNTAQVFGVKKNGRCANAVTQAPSITRKKSTHEKSRNWKRLKDNSYSWMGKDICVSSETPAYISCYY